MAKIPDYQQFSRVCRENRDQPNRAHAACQACDCTCHHVLPPARVRAEFEAAREAARAREAAERRDGAA